MKEMEEAADKYAENKSSSDVFKQAHKRDFIEGAKWQAERMYSKEEVFKLIDRAFHMYASSHRQDAKEWFEQIKEKL